MNSSTFNITPDIAERTADVYSTASPAQQASLNYDGDIMKLVEAAWNFKETQPACDSGRGGLQRLYQRLRCLFVNDCK